MYDAMYDGGDAMAILSDEQPAEATVIARIADTSAVNASLNNLRNEKFPLLFLMAMFWQSRVVLPRTKLPTCEADGLRPASNLQPPCGTGRL